MQASCKLDYIDVFDLGKFFLNKNKVAAIVVACDLFAVVLVFGMIFYL